VITVLSSIIEIDVGVDDKPTKTASNGNWYNVDIGESALTVQVDPVLFVKNDVEYDIMSSFAPIPSTSIPSLI
jgi:hypothetical protein